MLEDGAYDVFIVDANEDDDDVDVVHVTLTILEGAHKSDVIVLHARGLRRDSIELFGLPGTLVVRDGVPHLALDE
jgi:hypothetical protein